MTLEEVGKIKEIIKEYEEHDREAFDSRTEMFRVMMMLADTVEELLEKK